jgi:hypothetical protein
MEHSFTIGLDNARFEISRDAGCFRVISRYSELPHDDDDVQHFTSSEAVITYLRQVLFDCGIHSTFDGHYRMQEALIGACQLFLTGDLV